MNKLQHWIACASLSIAASACDNDDRPSEEDMDPAMETDAAVDDASSPGADLDGHMPDETPGGPEALPVERDGQRLFAVRFDLRAGESPFGCGKPAALGTNATMVHPVDARMYVHDVALVRADGTKVPLVLYQGGEYQLRNVALIDFADDTGQCFTGHPGTNNAVYGYAPPETDYTGVAFKVGVPEEENHFDGAVAPAPFNASGMWWSWSGGYKYLRLDLTSDAQPIWYFHGGAAGCSGTSVDGFSCAARQIAEVELQGFDTANSVVVFDAEAFYAGVDLSAADGLPGCMGSEGDPECAPLYASLGVNVWDDEAERPAQTVFSLTGGEPWQPPARDGASTTTDPLAWPDPDFERPAALDLINVSAADEARSHGVDDPRHGVSCMRCHQSHGPGIGQFTAAGTIFAADGSPASGVQIEIIEGTPDRANNTFTDVTRYALLDVDENGNFFTTAPLPYDRLKLTARVLDSEGNPIMNMFSTKQTGACNTCHTASFRITLPDAPEAPQ